VEDIDVNEKIDVEENIRREYLNLPQNVTCGGLF